MIGYSDWVTHHRFEVQSYVFQEQQVYDVAQYEDTETLNSTFDYGGFVELGATLNIYRKLYLEFLTQGELHHASYSDWEMEFNSENEGSYLIVEPSFSLGLRWEMR